ncbi:fimbrial biogenesis outer membrane usher protein [Haemophilus influenzae]|uniref:fimbria/pilus outer membrane usher protein n=1 Tax=Haemophilus influenzae TaxID=727 RepID=UPI000DD4CFC6|nr:fimbria/pilus outer membrane usher protein [Haemophilus influenzae]NXZ85291.1 fimbrial biogenesis outer membrane usher protein [Haemophilus influenzae]
MTKLTLNTGLSQLSLALGLAFAGFAETSWAEESLPISQEEKSPLESNDEDVEFSATFLQMGGNGSTVDVTRFQQKNSVLPGEYPAEVWVNNKAKGEMTLRFRDSENAAQPHAQLCFTPELNDLLDLERAAIRLAPKEDQCVSIQEAIPQGKAVFNTGLQRLEFTIAQALTINRPRDYIAPSRWQTGSNAAFVNYDVNHSRYTSQLNMHSSQVYLNLRTGINLGDWAFRHSGSKAWSEYEGKSSNIPYQTYETYLQKDFAPIRGLMTIGDFYTSGQFVEGFALRGIGLASDDRMLSPSQMGFAPRVQGIANSNAVVTIRQNGNIVYQTNVTPGPFVIEDLYSTGYNGDLTVEIKEANGQVRTFVVPFSNIAPLIRMGQFRYQVAAGRYRSGQQIFDINVGQAMLQYGLLNNLTLNTGVTLTRNYWAGTAGIGLNTPIGAFSFDNTWTRSIFLPNTVLVAQETLNPYREVREGYSLHGSYSINFNRTGTNVTLAAYRYSSRDFYNLSDVVNAKQFGSESQFSLTGVRPKNQYQISLIQDLKGLGSLYLVGSTLNYWNRTGTYSQYQVSYANNFKLLSYQLGFSQTIHRENGQRDNQIYLGFSIPLGSNHSLSANQTRGLGQKNTQVGLNGSFGDYNQWNYGLHANTGRNGYRNISGNINYRNTHFNFNSSISKDSYGSRQFSNALSGVIVAHRHGVTFGESVGESFAIVHADGAAGAEVNSGQGQVLDWFGNAVLPYTQPYRINEIGIDPQNLPINMEFDSTEQKIIPRANSIHVVNFGTTRNSLVLFNLSRPNGELLPMASEAFDENGNFVGYVVQGGVLFASGLKRPKGTITVSWASGETGQCRFDYEVKLDDSEHMQQHTKQCK